jgi:hypothetical protein
MKEHISMKAEEKHGVLPGGGLVASVATKDSSPSSKLFFPSIDGMFSPLWHSCRLLPLFFFCHPDPLCSVKVCPRTHQNRKNA